jgi:hypothetical protein
MGKKKGERDRNRTTSKKALLQAANEARKRKREGNALVCNLFV